MNPRFNRDRPLFSRDDMMELLGELAWPNGFPEKTSNWELAYVKIILNCATNGDARINRNVVNYHLETSQSKKFINYLLESDKATINTDKSSLPYIVNLAASWLNTAGRKNIPKPIRDKVFRINKGRCSYCLVKLTVGNSKCSNQFHVDHIIPWSVGGRNNIENLTASCRSCNISKSSTLIEDWVA